MSSANLTIKLLQPINKRILYLLILGLPSPFILIRIVEQAKKRALGCQIINQIKLNIMGNPFRSSQDAK